MAERIRNPENLVNYKFLKLITPEYAQELGVGREFGLRIETPVFISAGIYDSYECDFEGCEATYAPLLYGIGRSVNSHHFHEDNDSFRTRSYFGGGIYYYVDKDFKRLATHDEVFSSGWIGLIEPLGRIKAEGRQHRSEKALVKEVRAFCSYHPKREQLKQGQVVAMYDEAELEPVCKKLSRDNYYSEPRYDFKIEEGHVLFSQI